MGIQTQQRIAQALDDIEVVLVVIKSLTAGLTQAEQRIKDLEHRIQELEHGHRQPKTPRRN